MKSVLCVFMVLCRIARISTELVSLRTTLAMMVQVNDESFLPNDINDNRLSSNEDGSLSYEDDDNVAEIANADYPTYRSIPPTSFSCRGRNIWGYYADVEAGCQVFHICQSQHNKISFLCPIGSVFNQRHLICDWWYNFDCEPELKLLEEEARPFGYTPEPYPEQQPTQATSALEQVEAKRGQQ